MVYHKQCPLFGLDLGFGPFKKVEYTTESMPHCGYKTRYDTVSEKCVPENISHCETVTDLSSLETYDEKILACASHACGTDFNGRTCRDFGICKDVKYLPESEQETACKSNPICKWFDNNSFDKCNIDRGPPISTDLNGNAKITAECGKPQKFVRDLCAPGTVYSKGRCNNWT